MAYEPTVWVTGDVITAEKLNKAENGIAGATPLVCTIELVDETPTVVGATYKTISEALTAGKIVFAIDKLSGGIDATYIVSALVYREGAYIVGFGEDDFQSETEDGVLTMLG